MDLVVFSSVHDAHTSTLLAFHSASGGWGLRLGTGPAPLWPPRRLCSPPLQTGPQLPGPMLPLLGAASCTSGTETLPANSRASEGMEQGAEEGVVSRIGAQNPTQQK